MTKAVLTSSLSPVDIDATAIALYGAVRSAGEFVIASADRAAAAAIATRSLGYFINGLCAER